MSSEEVTVTFCDRSRRVPKGTPVGELFEPAERGKFIAARVAGKLVDLSFPLEHDAVVEPVALDSPAGLNILRHSTAHLMAQAVQSLYPGTQVTLGPATEEGFYYDFAPPNPFTSEDLPRIEQRMRELARADEKIERLEMTRDEAVELFASKGEQFKVEILRELPEERVSIYRQGDWMDLCRGPHVPSTGWIKAFALLSVAGAYWRGDEHNAMLSRIYGTAFADQKALDEHLELLKLARARDHRRLGRELGLIMFDPRAPGSPFFLPKGATVVNELIAYIRRLYDRYGFQEVITPQLFRNEIWRTSGHWELFRDNMFLTTDGENATGELDYGLKPMNCPAHAVIYASEKRSYRDLPLRLADFGRLHRAERSGVLHGLTRVRAMTQDDAHIFCALEQVAYEVDANLKMVREVYEALGFEQIELKLATMPEHHLGSEQTWRQTEAMLAQAMARNGLDYQTNPGEGAFYGPKIEIYVPDALKRRWQLATIQLDFNMPERFKLEYINSAGAAERPVMIHRAILGTIERFLGLLVEHTGGIFPFWLAPEQVRVLSLNERVENYAKEIAQRFKRERFRVGIDVRNEKLGFKVRQAELAKVPYMVIAGEREAATGTVSLRMLRGAKAQSMSVEELVARLKSEPLPG
jgi:threonyl-tRNA synthetase